MSLAPIPEALDALRAGRPIIVADDENRENEGDVVLSAELATPEAVAWTIRWSSGLLCAPMPAEWADRLDLPPMVAVNEDARGTAYTVTVDAADRTVQRQLANGDPHARHENVGGCHVRSGDISLP